MKKKKTQGVSLMSSLLLMGVLPLFCAAIIMILIASMSIKEEVERETFQKLKMGANSVNLYFDYDLLTNGTIDYNEYSDHEFVESYLDEEVDLTLFQGDTRFLTSLKNEDGSYNEGTQASEEVFAAVSKGKVFSADDVVINGLDYYVYYEPVYDGNQEFWGMAFAGTPQSAVKKAINSAVLQLIVSAVIIAILFSVIIALVAMKLKKSIVTIGTSLNGLSEGDLSVHVDASGGIKEIKDMINDTNRLQSKLSEVIGIVKTRSDALMESIGMVHTASGHSAQDTDQIVGAMEELATSTLVLTENVQSVNMQAITMGEHIQGIAQNVEALTKVSDTIQSETQNAQVLMTKVLDSSDQSSHATDQISESIKLTNESIVKITDAVNLISEIASQTNLLSLNASIEAARAGEAGRGFAVVAEEIGKLAMDSANTANTIRELADDMNDKSAKTVELAGQVANIIMEEKSTVESTKRAFDLLGTSIQESLTMISTIDAKSEELSDIKEGILSNISDLSAISEENAASNEEVTASVTGISERVNDMSAQCDSMQEMSEQLQESISYFK